MAKKTPKKKSNNPAGRPRIGKEKRVSISASVPESTAQWARQTAQERGETLSQFIAHVLKTHRDALAIRERNT